MPRPGSSVAQRHVPIDVPYSSSARDDEEHAGIRRAEARAPEEDAEQRHAERARDVEPRQHRQPGEPPADRADRRDGDERAAARTTRRARAR